MLVFGFASMVTADPKPPRTGVIDRVVGVVGRTPILQSEVRARARPYLTSPQFPKEPSARTIESQVMREVLDRIIDEVLIETDAKRDAITVSTEEVETAIQTVARTQNLSIDQLLRAARDAGLDENAYRAEIRRHVLDGKVTSIRVRGRLKGLSDLPEASRAMRVEQERRVWLGELRRSTFVEVRL